MTTHRLRGRAAAMLVMASALLAGCAAAGAEPGASSFFAGHAAGAQRAAAAARLAEARIAALPATPSTSQLEAVARAAARARRSLIAVSEWSTAQGGEEEDLVQAESEVTEGAADLANAMSALRDYASSPKPASRARYENELARGRALWNEGIVEIWYLAKRSGAPTA